ncbi:hypothetical protein K1719_008586 [Acacia pycnantha]|nr:hypothetical protein K1719_008586 [Acacia pycnantha]
MEVCQKGDSLVFYFSGHGIQFIDSKEDEIDRLDEGICPVDFLLEGAILDNEINSILVRPLKEDAHAKITSLLLENLSKIIRVRDGQFVLVLVKIIRWLLKPQLSWEVNEWCDDLSFHRSH